MYPSRQRENDVCNTVFFFLRIVSNVNLEMNPRMTSQTISRLLHHRIKIEHSCLVRLTKYICIYIYIYIYIYISCVVTFPVFFICGCIHSVILKVKGHLMTPSQHTQTYVQYRWWTFSGRPSTIHKKSCIYNHIWCCSAHIYSIVEIIISWLGIHLFK